MNFAWMHTMKGGDDMRKVRAAPWRQALLPTLFLLLLMLRADAARQAAIGGIKQGAMVVFPALFPFFVLSRRLTQSGILRLSRGERLCRRCFGVGTAGMGAVLLGFCGGYPLGVDAVCGLYEKGSLGRTAAQRLLLFCNNTGPGFFFGMVGAALFPNPGVCALLFVIHIASALLTGAILAQPAQAEPEPRTLPPAGQTEAFPASLEWSFFGALRLCGFVVFFSVALSLLLELPPLVWLLDTLSGGRPLTRKVLTALLSAALDLPSGIAAMALIDVPQLRFLLCAGGIAWGGACVHMQAAGLWQRVGLIPRGYYGAKLLQTGLSLALAMPAARLLFDCGLPLWPGLLPFLALGVKRVVAFLPRVGYNEKKISDRRPCHAVSEKN